MRSRTVFSPNEIAEIKALIERKLKATTQEQKAIRAQIRKNYRFWFSDFYPRGTAYNLENFEALLKNGYIKKEE